MSNASSQPKVPVFMPLAFGLWFLMFGTVILLVEAWTSYRDYRVNNFFLEASCVISSSTAIDEAARIWPAEEFRVKFAFTAEWSDYEAVAITDHALEKGREYPCWYDPENSGNAVLERPYRGWLRYIFVIGGLLLIAGGSWSILQGRRGRQKS